MIFRCFFSPRLSPFQVVFVVSCLQIQEKDREVDDRNMKVK